MDIVVIVGLMVVLSSIAVAVGLGRRHAWRWGEVPAGVERAGEGAYREARVQAVRPRGVPSLVSWSAGLGYVWAAVTFLVLAPSGLLLAVLGAESRGEGPALLVLIVCLSGFGLAIALVVAGTSLLRCRPGAAECARWVGWWSVGHHAAVLATMAVLAILWSGWFLVVPALLCVLGGLHAFSLLEASRLPGPAVPNAPDA